MQAEISEELQGAARIRAAAEQLFAEKGFAATSMQEVAVLAGVSKSNVFHHFKTKEDLYMDVLACACNEAHDRILPHLTGHGTFAERLTRMMVEDIEFMFAHPERMRLVLAEITATEPDDPAQAGPAVLQRNARDLVEALRAAQNAGEIRADVDPAATAMLFFAANIFYFQTRNLMRHFPEVDFADDHKRFVDKVSHLILNGVLPR